MNYACRVERDSLSPAGSRLTTFVVTFPRFILAEVNTHRMLSRNSASSRAIPVEKRLAAVEANPFIPEQFGRNQKGMQAGEPLADKQELWARGAWVQACQSACKQARYLAELGVHKQLANRLLEPFSWHTAIITATDWDHFFSQRCHPDAQPEFYKIACMMRDAMQASVPRKMEYGQWHLPFVDEWFGEPGDSVEEWQRWKLISVGRCARVSYETHEGKRDLEADIALAERLRTARPMHASPFEHVATPSEYLGRLCGNFTGWVQYRKLIESIK